MFNVSLNEVLNGKKDFEVLHPKKMAKKDYKNSGIFVFDVAQITDKKSTESVLFFSMKNQ